MSFIAQADGTRGVGEDRTDLSGIQTGLMDGGKCCCKLNLIRSISKAR